VGEAKRQALVDSLRRITPEMREQLRGLKEWGISESERTDFVWHILLQSFATWGGSRGFGGLIDTPSIYGRITFDALSALDRGDRLRVLSEALSDAKVRWPNHKAVLLDRNHDMIAEMGGPEVARRLALAQEGGKRRSPS
jgi:hypothetical protein